MKRGTILSGMMLTITICCLSALAFGAPVSEGIKVGNAGAFTGDAAAPCMEIYNSAQIAVDEWNAKGGIQGVKIKQIMGDDAMDPALAAFRASSHASHASTSSPVRAESGSSVAPGMTFSMIS